MNGIAYSQNGGNMFCVRVFLYILFEDEVLNSGSDNDICYFPRAASNLILFNEYLALRWLYDNYDVYYVQN